MLIAHLTNAFGPVVTALHPSLLHHLVQHDHPLALLLPHHLPEVAARLLQRTLRQNVLPARLVRSHQAAVDVVCEVNAGFL